MSDPYGLGTTARAEPIGPDQDNVNVTPMPVRNERGQFIPFPSTEEPMNAIEPTTEEVTKAVGIFQYMADSVVRASQFAAELKSLKVEFDALRRQVEVYRETNARLDEEVSNLRRERQALQDENGALRADKSELESNLSSTRLDLHNISADRDRIQTDWINQNDTLRQVQVNLSDEQRRVRDLEEQVRALTADRDTWHNQAINAKEHLARIRDSVNSQSAA